MADKRVLVYAVPEERQFPALPPLGPNKAAVAVFRKAAETVAERRAQGVEPEYEEDYDYD